MICIVPAEDGYVNYITVSAGMTAKTMDLLRGGNWDNGSNAGAFTLNLNWVPSNSNNNVGFRCAVKQINTA